ncbi:MAG: serine protease [Bdellovibrionota bacterium]
MKSNGSYFNLVLYVLVAAFFIADLTHAEPGFYSPDDPSIPLAVREASKSVFAIATKVPVVSDEFPASEYEEKKKFYWGIKSIASGVKVDLINRCISRKLPTCELSGFFGATAFLYEDNKTVMSAFHVISSALPLNAYSTMKESDIPYYFSLLGTFRFNFYLMHITDWITKKFAYVAQSEAGKGAVLESAGNTKIKLTNIFNETNLDRDFAQIKLEGTVSTSSPLKRAAAQPKEGDEVFVVGYPIRSTNRPNQMNAQGRTLYITKGKYLRTAAVRSTGVVSPVRHDIDADACDEMSGSPVLNINAEVVGVLVAGSDELSNNCNIEPQRESNYLSIHHIEELQTKILQAKNSTRHQQQHARIKLLRFLLL